MSTPWDSFQAEARVRSVVAVMTTGVSPQELLTLFGVSGDALLSFLGACARVVPSVVLIPAFGLGLVPLPIRFAILLSLGATLAPAVGLHGATTPQELIVELLWGIPVALVASVGLWAAMMAGGAIDQFRTGAGRVANQDSSPIGLLLSLLAAGIFLEGGGATKVAWVLARPLAPLAQPLTQATFVVASGIELALLLASPVIFASFLFEMATVLWISPRQVSAWQGALRPLSALMVLGVLALSLEGLATTLGVATLDFDKY